MSCTWHCRRVDPVVCVKWTFSVHTTYHALASDLHPVFRVWRQQWDWSNFKLDVPKCSSLSCPMRRNIMPLPSCWDSPLLAQRLFWTDTHMHLPWPRENIRNFWIIIMILVDLCPESLLLLGISPNIAHAYSTFTSSFVVFFAAVLSSRRSQLPIQNAISYICN